MLGPGIVLAGAALCGGATICIAFGLGALGGALCTTDRSRASRTSSSVVPDFPAQSGPAALPDKIPGLNLAMSETKTTDQALDVVIELERRWQGGSLSNLQHLLPYLKHHNPLVRSITVRTIDEYLLAVAQPSQDKPTEAKLCWSRLPWPCAGRLQLRPPKR